MTTSHIRALIVDDEPLARRGIRARLAAFTDVSVVGECANGRTAVDSIHSLAPDLIFLDVQMPEVDGFAVVESVTAERMPIVIFVTAYDSHALRAFEAHAIDYLLKPIDDTRFAQALGRVRERVRDRTAGALAERLSALLADVSRTAAPSLDRVTVRDRGCVVLLDPRDIEWVAADGDYLRISASARSYLVRETLTAMEARLPASRFARIHRSSIVNVEHIAALEPLPNREFVVVLRDGTRLRSSRSYVHRLRRVLDALM
jgi:two-component system LytT family response regulator